VRLILEISKRIREESGISAVALSGGVFQNKYLLSQSVRILRENNFIVLINRIVPPNDGGISFGQIGHYIYSRSS
jgi:hydrogenase maturation protein HypF